MAWRRWQALALVGLALIVAGTAVAEKCTTQGPWGTIEYDCGAASGASTEDTPWWADDRTQSIVAFAGIVGSIGAAGVTYYLVRQRRKTLADFVNAVERTYAESKADPAAGVPKLASLRSEVRARHARGRIEDAHFLELDKRITGYLARLRVLEVERRFPGLPPAYLNEVRHLVGDGVVSRADATRLGAHASLWRLQPTTRDELAAMLEGWAVEDQRENDSTGSPVAAMPPA